MGTEPTRSPFSQENSDSEQGSEEEDEESPFFTLPSNVQIRRPKRGLPKKKEETPRQSDPHKTLNLQHSNTIAGLQDYTRENYTKDELEQLKQDGFFDKSQTSEEETSDDSDSYEDTASRLEDDSTIVPQVQTRSIAKTTQHVSLTNTSDIETDEDEIEPMAPRPRPSSPGKAKEKRRASTQRSSLMPARKSRRRQHEPQKKASQELSSSESEDNQLLGVKSQSQKGRYLKDSRFGKFDTGEGRCHKCFVRSRLCHQPDPTKPCTQCVRNQFICKPIELQPDGSLPERKYNYVRKTDMIIGSGLSLEEKCYRCLKGEFQCKGNPPFSRDNPCNHCAKLKQGKCRSVEQHHLERTTPKCTRCNSKYCDRGQPCFWCRTTGKKCTYYCKKTGTSTSYLPIQVENDICAKCRNHRKNCSPMTLGGGPCEQCMFGRAKGTEGAKRIFKTCSRHFSPNIHEAVRIQA